MTNLVQQIKSACAKYRMTFGSELELQDQLAEIFTIAGIAFEREYKLSAADRPDFFIAPFAIEVKVGGSLNSHLRQLQRYNLHGKVAGTIFISTKPFFLPETLAGKPVEIINVGGNRL